MIAGSSCSTISSNVSAGVLAARWFDLFQDLAAAPHRSALDPDGGRDSGPKIVTPSVTPKPNQARGSCGRFANFPSLPGIFGSGGRDRTYDQLINSQLLYR